LNYSPKPNLFIKLLFCFFENNMLLHNRIIFFIFNTIRMKTLIFCNRIPIASSGCAFNLNNISLTVACHFFTYSTISVTTPAPTVWPPSRIANRSSCSIAIGVISSTFKLTLSPGITISVPSGRIIAPVTSVVLK